MGLFGRGQRTQLPLRDSCLQLPLLAVHRRGSHLPPDRHRGHQECVDYVPCHNTQQPPFYLEAWCAPWRRAYYARPTSGVLLHLPTGGPAVLRGSTWRARVRLCRRATHGWHSPRNARKVFLTASGNIIANDLITPQKWVTFVYRFDRRRPDARRFLYPYLPQG